MHAAVVHVLHKANTNTYSRMALRCRRSAEISLYSAFDVCETIEVEYTRETVLIPK